MQKFIVYNQDTVEIYHHNTYSEAIQSAEEEVQTNRDNENDPSEEGNRVVLYKAIKISDETGTVYRPESIPIDSEGEDDDGRYWDEDVERIKIHGMRMIVDGEDGAIADSGEIKNPYLNF
jgi:hypothetical protein